MLIIYNEKENRYEVFCLEKMEVIFYSSSKTECKQYVENKDERD